MNKLSVSECFRISLFVLFEFSPCYIDFLCVFSVKRTISTIYLEPVSGFSHGMDARSTRQVVEYVFMTKFHHKGPVRAQKLSFPWIFNFFFIRNMDLL